MHKQMYHICILLWCTGLTVLFAIDYGLRLLSDNYHSLGMNGSLWFLLQIMLAIATFTCLIRAVKQMPTHKALLVSISTMFVGAVFYFVATWLYVVGTGVDSV